MDVTVLLEMVKWISKPYFKNLPNTVAMFGPFWNGNV